MNTAHDIGSGLKKGISAFGKYMDPASRTRELLTIIITTTVVAMAAFAFFQGQIGVGAAVSMIAIAGVICLTLTLGFNGIKKLFGDSTDKVKNFVDNDQRNLGNDSTDLAAKEQQSQSKDTESPNSKMDNVRTTRQHCLEKNTHHDCGMYS
ncbi:hypothetical protein [Wolbachia endosymbiont of Ctenocephalides felis wCfeJ]|uniref:hypothetical protein n=1 Tax=Wolbachia endosymbiont of Ctenocephalides felis wCfeJ TaxID=2732594 RepID=UPI001446251E|nr:hypothetical protein [Wolbachia endosymbiont of Ctenocephalides felis wCfeJ]WCR57709.1 MAG: hypothetical protein PG980_000181 [Wolbachia endosymbiont of Ctenocephalides felis wCfeJ]